MKSAEKEKAFHFRGFFTRYQSEIAMIIGIAAIVYFGMYNISKNTSLRIVGDEFGYWSAGATFAGIDWKSVASYNSFYGYGYGIILAPILKLGVPQTVKYQIAIGVNVFMLVCIYTLIYRTLKKEGSQPVQAMFIALVSTLYSGNLVYAQYTFSETFILFLYILFVISFTAFLKKEKVAYAILLPIIICILLATHKRTVALVPVLAVFFIFLLLKWKNYRALLAFVLSAILIAASYYVITKLYKEAINLRNPNTNQLSGQIGKIKELFTAEGVSKFFIGFLGKTAYSGLTSFSIVFVAAVRIVKNICSEIRSGKIRKITLLGLYFLTNLLAMEAISTVFLLDFTGRRDLLTYGRYHEFTVSVLIVYELYMGFVKREKLHLTQIVFSGSLAIALTITVYHFLPNLNATGHMAVSSPGISFFLNDKDHLILLLIICLAVMLMYYYSISCSAGLLKEKSHQTAAVALVLIMLFSYVAYTSLNKTYSWSIEGCTREEKLARRIQEDEAVEKIMYYVPDSTIDIDFMQFLLNDKSITCFSDVSVLDDLGENDRILTTVKSRLITDEWNEQYELLGSSSFLKYWKKK